MIDQPSKKYLQLNAKHLLLDKNKIKKSIHFDEMKSSVSRQ